MNQYEEKLERRRERLKERADKQRDLSDQHYQRSKDLVEPIPFGQPILVGHHSERAHRNRLNKSWDAMGRSVKASEYADELDRQADAVGSGGISSEDPEAIQKLTRELNAIRKNQEIMKAINKAWRKAGKPGKESTEEEWDKLYYELEKCTIAPLSMFEAVKKGIANDFMNRAPFTYQLQNNNANAKRIEGRINELKSNSQVSIDEEFENGITVEKSDDNKIVITFPGKPSEEMRSRLKSNAFKWSRYRVAWVRKITANALYAYKRNVQPTLKEYSE